MALGVDASIAAHDEQYVKKIHIIVCISFQFWIQKVKKVEILVKNYWNL